MDFEDDLRSSLLAHDGRLIDVETVRLANKHGHSMLGLVVAARQTGLWAGNEDAVLNVARCGLGALEQLGEGN